MSSPAYQYGQYVAAWHRGMQRLFEQIGAGFRDGLAAPPPTPEQRAEAASRRRYRARVEAERRKGLRFVRDHGAQVRRELGLPS